MSTRMTPYGDEAPESGGAPSGFGWTPAPRRARPKPFYLTSEFLVMLATIAAVVIAASASDSLDAARAWTLVTVLAAAYIVSRGLSKIAHGEDPTEP